MDRLIYTSLNALDAVTERTALSAQNLANMGVPGFRRDMTQSAGAAFLVPGGPGQEDGGTSRAFRLDSGQNGFSRAEGRVERTGDPMDISLSQGGFLIIAPAAGGAPALSRRGDLRVADDGSLTNGAGDRLLGSDLGPIRLPPFRSIAIDEVGQVLVEPRDGAPGERVLAGVIATVSPPAALALAKGPDGQIRRADGGDLPPPDQIAQVMQGQREGSNVTATDELVETLELQRSFEVNLRMIQTAREIDEAGAALLRMPGG
ncbi:flagellar basal body rod C-terminal domain-containing protein [Frigidibacter oleivorans]|uniref:flagellar basal body rod C-terminal domain-containing protein n=1 Tax=Frigidibacter oleivorans TaxID=2487129 RepID=UPI000F8C6F60|nr:flagellar basal body rod C-terminal domain-containing protein [Frigidibacter oleivorans]